MTRTKMPTESETAVLVESRRRCCICFALDRDTSVKPGQIAHLDGKNSNHNIQNLAFLCFEHHDEYDTKTSQRKGYKIQEVKKYKEELLEWMGSSLSQKVHFGVLSLPTGDPHAGHWIRLGDDDNPAELQIVPLPDTIDGRARYFVSGAAFHGVSKEFGPNIGELEFYSEVIDGNCLFFSRRPIGGYGPATTELKFTSDGFLKVWEEDTAGHYGMGVTFDGLYRRA